MDRLGEIKTPTLVMAGCDDFLFPPEHQAALRGRASRTRACGSSRTRRPQRPHERPAEVIGAIRQFLGATKCILGTV